MSEQFEAVLADIIKKTATTAEAAGSFVLSEIPEIVNQLLVWKFWVAMTWSVVSFAVFIIANIYGFKYLIKGIKEHDHDIGFLGTIILIPNFLTILPVTIINTGIWMQIWLAPKIYLIEYASKLTLN